MTEQQKTKLRVVEIFNSIDGEGKRTGELTTFIRLAGCNLHCAYCDTAYAQKCEQGNEMTVEQIVSQVKHKNVTITGGEPLIHEGIRELIDELMEQHVFSINIETNGSVNVESFRPFIPTFVDPSREFFFTMDYKLPSSGQESEMYWHNLIQLKSEDVLKFVAGSMEDLNRMKEILEELAFRVDAKIYVSPVFGDIDPKDIVKFLQDNDLEDVTLQLQMHKIIWEPSKRGV